MKSKLLADSHPEKTWALIFAAGDEAMAVLKSFAEVHSIRSAHFTAIGAFSRATLGYFDMEKKEYLRIPVDEQVEVVTLIGDIALEDGKPKLHAHAALGQRSGAVIGGHLLEGHVRPTLEVILSESPKHLERHFDPQAGLALIRL